MIVQDWINFNGFKITFYDNSKIASNLSNYADIDEKNNVMIANVSVISKKSDKKLETEKLILNEKKEKVYTNEEVVITTANEVIYAQGFESNLILIFLITLEF